MLSFFSSSSFFLYVKNFLWKEKKICNKNSSFPSSTINDNYNKKLSFPSSSTNDQMDRNKVFSNQSSSQQTSQSSLKSAGSTRPILTSGFSALMAGGSARTAMSTSSIKSVDKTRKDGGDDESNRARDQQLSMRNESMPQANGGQDLLQFDSPGENKDMRSSCSNSSEVRHSVTESETYASVLLSPKPAPSNRKRSRTAERNSSACENETSSVQTNQFTINLLIEELQTIINQVFSKGDRGKTQVNKALADDVCRKISKELVHITTKFLNRMEEQTSLYQQVIFLNEKINSGTTDRGGSYAPQQFQQVPSREVAKAISTGTQLPPPNFPSASRHSPSENILIFKSPIKGAIPSKETQEAFRKEVAEVIGEVLFKEVSVIRPTRYGGYIIIFRTSSARDEAATFIRDDEERQGINIQNSCMIAPKKKVAKVLCRAPPHPDEATPQDVQRCLYGAHNPHLHHLPMSQRGAKIFVTRLGWVFEITAGEAVAIHAQGGRIRYQGRELKVEEFVPLQQCYKCCLFGHNATECLAEEECCRLCGEFGHSGINCELKEQKEQWRCANCMWHNMTNGTHLPIDHAAAQMHKCPVAQHERSVKKNQLAAAGVFTSPPQTTVRRQTVNTSTKITPITATTAPSSVSNTQGETVLTVPPQGSSSRRRTKSRGRKQPAAASSSSTSSSSAFSQSASSVSNSNSGGQNRAEQRKQPLSMQQMYAARKERGRSSSRPLRSNWHLDTMERHSVNGSMGGSGTMLAMNHQSLGSTEITNHDQ